MKSPFETLQDQLKARFPRVVSGDNEVVDDVDAEHTVERLAPLYQLPAWQILREMKDVSRKLRVETLPRTSWPCQRSWALAPSSEYENSSDVKK
jgi:hypothetical protein